MSMHDEIRQARSAGIQALNSLRQAQRSLDRARNWGIVDMLGGGLLTGLMKHSNMDEARACVQRARDDLMTFRDELGDVDLPELNANFLLKFADLMYDGFLIDFITQSQINKARQEIEQACDQVEDILRRLPRV